jgi:hypothetical protein
MSGLRKYWPEMLDGNLGMSKAEQCQALGLSDGTIAALRREHPYYANRARPTPDPEASFNELAERVEGNRGQPVAESLSAKEIFMAGYAAGAQAAIMRQLDTPVS